MDAQLKEELEELSDEKRFLIDRPVEVGGHDRASTELWVASLVAAWACLRSSSSFEMGFPRKVWA